MNSEHVFSGSEFKMAWGLLLSKRHNPAKSLELFTVTGADGVERYNIGINCMTGRVIFPARSRDTVSQCFKAVAVALLDDLEPCNHNCETYYTEDGDAVCGDCGEQLD